MLFLIVKRHIWFRIHYGFASSYLESVPFHRVVRARGWGGPVGGVSWDKGSRGLPHRLILVLLHVLRATVDRVDPDIEYAGVHDDGSADANPRQMVWGELSSELEDDADEQIIQCLEHVRQHDLS
jgi:hypothetical protein